MVFLHFCIWHRVSPSGVVLRRRSDLLLSDRDERNDNVGTARDGLCAFCCSVWFPPGCQEWEYPTHRHNCPRDNIEGHQLNVKVGAELPVVNPRLFCGTGDATRGLDRQVVLWSVVCFFLSCGVMAFYRHVRQKMQVSWSRGMCRILLQHHSHLCRGQQLLSLRFQCIGNQVLHATRKDDPLKCSRRSGTKHQRRWLCSQPHSWLTWRSAESATADLVS